MDHDPRGYLNDVRNSADSISRFLEGVTEADCLKNDLVRAAVERHFEIIGEALTRLAKTSPDLAAEIPSIARIIGFRNLLIHGYRAVNSQTVWRIAQERLPALRHTAANLLEELGNGPDALLLKPE